MRTWAAVGVWLVILVGGGIVVAVGQDRWLIAGGGALVGAGVMVLIWSLMLQALCGSLRVVLRELRRELRPELAGVRDMRDGRDPRMDPRRW